MAASLVSVFSKQSALESSVDLLALVSSIRLALVFLETWLDEVSLSWLVLESLMVVGSLVI